MTAKKLPWYTIFRLALGLATLVYVIYWLSGQEFPHIPLNQNTVFWFSLALLSLVPALWFRAVKWYLIIQPTLKEVTIKDALKSYMGAMSLSMMTPGRVGELARLLYLKPAPKGKMQGASLVLLDKFIDLGSLMCYCALGCLLFFNIQIAVAVLLLAIVILSIPLWLKKSGPFIKWPFLLIKMKIEKISFLEEMSYGLGRTTLIAFCGLGCFAVEWIQTWMLMNIWTDGQASLLLVCQVMSVITMVNVFQITFAGLGVREGLSGYWFQKFASIPPVVGASAAFFLFLIDQIIPSLIGLKIKTYQENHPADASDRIENR